MVDIYEKRGYNGEIAKKLMQKIIKEDNIIIYSNFISMELKRIGYSRNEINQIYRLVESANKRIVHVTKEQFSEGKG
ncbi:hypothetical protein HYV89_04495 [Candidatus Woesearchaeota archaeon]|nr:hypothetical protein [Candidatus Woesearchaeota archaeon]